MRREDYTKEDKIVFMSEIEDRESDGTYRRQNLSAKLMDVDKPVSAGASVKKCLHCGFTVPMQVSFCAECEGKMR